MKSLHGVCKRPNMPRITIPADAAHNTAREKPNESLHLGEFGRACLAEALLLRNLA